MTNEEYSGPNCCAACTCVDSPHRSRPEESTENK